MGREYSTYGGNEKFVQNQKGRGHLKDLGVHERIVLKRILKK
jgi:hypothetical protein